MKEQEKDLARMRAGEGAPERPVHAECATRNAPTYVCTVPGCMVCAMYRTQEPKPSDVVSPAPKLYTRSELREALKRGFIAGVEAARPRPWASLWEGEPQRLAFDIESDEIRLSSRWIERTTNGAQTTGHAKLDRYVDKVAELEALAKGLTEKDYARNTSDDCGRGALSGAVPVGRASGREGTTAAVSEASVAATERTRSPFPAEILSSERRTPDGPRDTASSSSSSSDLATLRASLITLRDQWRTKAGYMQTGSACWAIKSCVDELDALLRDTPPEQP